MPLQIFLDNAIKSLERVNKQEFRVNNLMDQFVKGEVSEDEVVLETAKLNLAISMVTTIVQSAVQTFKEIPTNSSLGVKIIIWQKKNHSKMN